MAKNSSEPVITMMTKPAMVHGSRRSRTSDTGTLRMMTPRRRKSTTAFAPTRSAKPNV